MNTALKCFFLPPYSPDLNPIENFWSNVKRRLRLHMHQFAIFRDAPNHTFKLMCTIIHMRFFVILDVSSNVLTF
ncbi:MAG: transposase [Oscillospiraceae bacterium]|nr:transposase [Oscillospiraceae bacterium]